MAEVHRGAHTRSSCTTARTRLRDVHGARARGRCVRAASLDGADRRRRAAACRREKPIACVALTSCSFLAQRAPCVVVPAARTLKLTTWRIVGLPGGNAWYAVGVRRPPPDAGTQPMCGRNRRARDVAHDAAEEDGLARRRDPRVDRAAEGADEADLDAAARQLGVEARDDVPLRAGELELDAAGRRDDPRPDDRHAHLQPAALVRRARGRRRRPRSSRRAASEDERAPHGTSLRNQKAESAPPASRSTAAPTAEEVGDLRGSASCARCASTASCTRR